jgi:hypothetical protein
MGKTEACPPAQKRFVGTHTPVALQKTAMPFGLNFSGLAGFHALGGVKRGQNDALIAGTAAKITGNRNPDLPLGRLRVISQKFQ